MLKASKSDTYFLIQLLFEIQDDSLVFQYLCNRNTRSFAEYLQKASVPILGAPDPAEECNISYALKFHVLTALRNRASGTDIFSTHRRLRRLLLRLALEYDLLPRGIHVAGVSCANSESVMCGGFADIYRGEHKGKVVALKRLRVFQMMEPLRKQRVKKVSSESDIRDVITDILARPSITRVSSGGTCRILMFSRFWGLAITYSWRLHVWLCLGWKKGIYDTP